MGADGSRVVCGGGGKGWWGGRPWPPAVVKLKQRAWPRVPSTHGHCKSCWHKLVGVLSGPDASWAVAVPRTRPTSTLGPHPPWYLAPPAGLLHRPTLCEWQAMTCVRGQRGRHSRYVGLKFLPGAGGVGWGGVGGGDKSVCEDWWQRVPWWSRETLTRCTRFRLATTCCCLRLVCARHQQYRIMVTCTVGGGPREWEVRRRFSDFVELDKIVGWRCGGMCTSVCVCSCVASPQRLPTQPPAPPPTPCTQGFACVERSGSNVLPSASFAATPPPPSLPPSPAIPSRWWSRRSRGRG